jgi:hypothetical protein
MKISFSFAWAVGFEDDFRYVTIPDYALAREFESPVFIHHSALYASRFQSFQHCGVPLAFLLDTILFHMEQIVKRFFKLF